MRAITLLALAALGCTDLPPIAQSTCGNAVIEPSNGEDCDSFATTTDSVCLPPGDARECRYDCSPGSDGTRPPCPAGMGCGVDGTCRWASQAFEATATLIQASPRALVTGDVDGDRRDDLAVVERDRAVVHYFGDSAALDAELVVPSASYTEPFPVMAELSGDSMADLVVPHEVGVVAVLGNAGRTLRPTAYPSVVLPEDVDEAHYVSVDLFPQIPGEEVLLLASTKSNPVAALVYVDKTLGIEQITATLQPSQLADGLLVGGLNEDPVDSPCDEIVLPFRDLKNLFVFSPCKRDPAKGIVINANGASTTVDLHPGDLVVGPVVLADIDHDGHLDLGCVGTDGTERFIEVAYGLGDGSFHSSTPVPAVGDGFAARAGTLAGAKPLALGDLNGDGKLDYVDATGVYVQRPSGWERTGKSGSTPFAEAVIADLNGNGIPDVLAAFSESPGALFFNGGKDGYSSSWEVMSEGRLAQLEVGDFDGDLILDVAAAEAASPGRDFLSILFGDVQGAPHPSAHMGLMDSIRQVARARANPAGEPETIEEDLVTISESNGRLSFAGFPGRTDRNLRSPYVVVRTVGGSENLSLETYLPHRLAAGSFDADPHADLTELAATDAGLRLWLVPMREQAGIQPSDARPSELLPEDVEWKKSSMAAGDLDDDGTDELVLLAPSKQGSGSVGWVARSVDSGDGFRNWSLGPAAALSQRFEQDDAGGVGRRLLVEDLDANGAKDVIALDVDGRLRVHWGDGTTSFSGFEAEVESSGKPIVAFALVQADRDAAWELVVVSGSRAYLADLGADGAYHLGAEVAAHEGAVVVTAGDFDGDGVSDVALGSPASVAVFRGIPGLP